MEMNIGHHAATRQSYRDETSMKEFVTRLRDEYPEAGVDEIIRRFAERARGDDHYLNAAVEHSVLNTWNSMERLLRQSIQRPAPHIAAAAKQERETKIQAAVEQIMLLNQEMPNGKRLRYCTREDISKWSAGYERMAKKMKPGQMVGQTFNEDQVKEILK